MYELGIVLVGTDANDLGTAFYQVLNSKLPSFAVMYVPAGFADEAWMFSTLTQQAPHPARWSCYERKANDTQAQSIGRALNELHEVYGTTIKHYAVISADVLTASDWFDGMRAALDAKTVRNEAGEFKCLLYGRPAYVGPVSDGIALPAQHLDLDKADTDLGVQGYAAHRAKHLHGVAGIADTLDPCFVLGSSEDMVRLSNHLSGEATSDRYRWSQAWQDDTKEARAIVAEGVYAARTKPNRPGAWTPGDGLARLDDATRYVDARSPQRVVATIVATLDTARSIDLLKACLASCAGVVDGIALVIDGDPTQALDEAIAAKVSLQPDDEKMLKGCVGVLAEAMSARVTTWAKRIALAVTGNKEFVCEASVYGGPDALEARQRAYDLADSLGARWLLFLEGDEMLDTSVSRAYIQRLANHPDRSVLAYDFGFITHYNSPIQIRVDGARGTTMERGPSGIRMVRNLGGNRTQPGFSVNGGLTIAPLFSEESVRAANVRIRKFDLMRPQDRLHVSETAESVSVYAYHDQTRMGFHCLAYPRENLDDVGRWLDYATGICDDAVLVWTDEAEPSPEWKRLAAIYQARIVHHPLRDNLAAARNAGIDALSENKSLTWAWFVDPDEWFDKPLHDAQAMRRMAESVRYGYLVQTCNYRQSGPPSVSDSVRISRLLPTIRMDGRVHEGFSDAWKRLQAAGIHPRLVYAPFMVQHRGMAFSADRMREKLEKYEHLLRLELADRPENPGAWTSLAMHFMNDGHKDLAVECLRRGVACAGTSYLPYRELAYWHLREAQALLDQSIDRLSEGHQWYKMAAELQRVLRKHVEPASIVAPISDRPVASLPKFRDS